MLFELKTKLGDGCADVDVSAQVSGDGEDDEGMLIEDMQVMFQDRDIFNALTIKQVEDLKTEIEAAYLKAAQDSNEDLAIARYLSTRDQAQEVRQ